MKPLVIIMNGPPGSGKDELGSGLAREFGFKTLAVKEPLYISAAKYYNMDLEEFKRIATDRSLKELPDIRLRMYTQGTGDLIAISPRQAMIHVSEDIDKPAYGKDVYSKQAADKIPPEGVVFTDCGFPEELDSIVQKVESLGGLTVIVKLRREGTSFGGDSRNYLNNTADYPHVHSLFYENKVTVSCGVRYLTRSIDSIWRRHVAV